MFNPPPVIKPGDSDSERGISSDLSSVNRRKFLRIGGAATTGIFVGSASIAKGVLPNGLGSWRVKRTAPPLFTPPATYERLTAYGAEWTDTSGNKYRVRLDGDFSFDPMNLDTSTSFLGKVTASYGARIEKQTGGAGAWGSYFTIRLLAKGHCSGTFRVETPDNNQEIAYLEDIEVKRISNADDAHGYDFTLTTSSAEGSFTGSKNLNLKVRITKDADGIQPATDVSVEHNLTVLLTE